MKLPPGKNITQLTHNSCGIRLITIFRIGEAGVKWELGRANPDTWIVGSPYASLLHLLSLSNARCFPFTSDPTAVFPNHVSAPWAPCFPETLNARQIQPKFTPNSNAHVYSIQRMRTRHVYQAPDPRPP